MRRPDLSRPARATTLIAVAFLMVAACNSPTVPTTPTGSPLPGASTSASGSGGPGTPGPSSSHTTRGSPTPGGSPLGGDPCRLLTTNEVNGALGDGYQDGTARGLACVFPGDSSAGSSGLVSVAVVDGDAMAPIRSRYPDLKDVTVDAGTAGWSPSVGTLWLVTGGPRTVMVSILGTAFSDGQVQQIALQLALLAAGRI